MPKYYTEDCEKSMNQAFSVDNPQAVEEGILGWKKEQNGGLMGTTYEMI